MEAEYIQINGTVSGVVYQNSENGYTVLRMRDENGDSVTAVGCLPDAVPGEELILTGNWVTHQSYGQQFKIEWAERRLPSGAAAIYEYLAAHTVKGVGPRTARALVDKFGEDTFEILENQPEKLTQIKGISRQKAMEISASFRRQAGLRVLIEFLAKYGLRPQLAMRLYKCYGTDAVDAVKNNPYIIVGEYFGADFFEADDFALNLGFDGDSPQRIEAAVIFELRHNTGNGHTFLPADKLAAATDKLIGVGQENILEAMGNLADSGFIHICDIAGVRACYLADMFENEDYVARRLLQMAGEEAERVTDPERVICDIEREQGIKYAGGQREAVRTALDSSVMVLTGGPGTGKTTTVRGILALFDRMGYSTALAAPTGRAAKRMGEVCGREASTVHRMLGAGYSGDGTELTFEKCGSDPIEADAVILDETSMVDITLMCALLHAMRPGCRLIMVGDADQLPSVGPGNVFADVIRSGAVPVVRLTEIFRQARESRIVKGAHLINHGELPDLKENKGDFFFLRRMTAEKTSDTVVELCASRLPKNMGIPPGQIQVLSPSRKGRGGTVSLNLMLQEAINPPAEGKKERKYGKFVFREGDRVMQIRNNYDIMWKRADGTAAGTGVFNGDIGSVVSIDEREETLTVDFDDRIAVYTFDMLNELEPAYAITVHKAQGSEYRAVVLAVSDSAPALAVRSVLYTAVTRAKELLVIVGDDGVLMKMAENDRRQRRYSGLRARLCGE